MLIAIFKVMLFAVIAASVIVWVVNFIDSTPERRMWAHRFHKLFLFCVVCFLFYAGYAMSSDGHEFYAWVSIACAFAVAVHMDNV